jgi:dextranase
VEITPRKTFFSPNDDVSFNLQGSEGSFSFYLYELNEVTLHGFGEGDSLQLGRLKTGSYHLSIQESKSTSEFSFEVLKSPFSAPRYGFLSHFEKKDIDYPFETFFLKSHIYIAQFYDWMYRHEDYLSPSPDFIDPMGKAKNMDAVASQIASCQKIGVLPFAYGALYGATNEYAAKHPDERFYDGMKNPLSFIDRFTIMNFADSSWRKRIIDNYLKALDFGFSGIHVDTYGEPKEAYSSSGKLIHFEKEFNPFLEELHQSLKERGFFTFNNVGAWPLATTSSAPTAFSYCEVWDPLSDYDDLLNLSRGFHLLNKEKKLVLAAYLKPFYEDEETGAVTAGKYLAAVIYSSGSFHLLFGNNGEALRTGYYPDSRKLSQEGESSLLQYEDFSVRYGELLFDSSLTDVSFTKAFMDNGEYLFDSPFVSPHAKAHGILSIIREKEGCKIISLINMLLQKDAKWNESKKEEPFCEPFGVSVKIPSSDYEAFASTPEAPSMTLLPSKVQFVGTSMYLRFSSTSFSLWCLIVIRKKKS